MTPLLVCAQASAPPPVRYGLAHQSVFEHYTPHTSAPIQPWRDSNQRVLEIGGWRSYLRSVQPDSVERDKGSQAPAQSPGNRHEGHTPAAHGPKDAGVKP